MALQWNALEADRVGLPEDARTFRARMGTYQEQVNAIRKKRETAEQYWQDLEKKYLALKDGTQKKIADLNKQVSQLQGEVREVASQPRTGASLSLRLSGRGTIRRRPSLSGLPPCRQGRIPSLPAPFHRVRCLCL